MTSLGGALGLHRACPSTPTLFWAGLGVTAVLVVAYRLKASSYGRAFLSIREDEIAAEAMGVPVAAARCEAFVLAAFFAGIAGGLFAHEVGTALNPRGARLPEVHRDRDHGGAWRNGTRSRGLPSPRCSVTVLPEWLRQPTHVWPWAWCWCVAVLLPLEAAAVGGALPSWPAS